MEDREILIALDELNCRVELADLAALKTRYELGQVSDLIKKLQKTIQEEKDQK